MAVEAVKPVKLVKLVPVQCRCAFSGNPLEISVEPNATVGELRSQLRLYYGNNEHVSEVDLFTDDGQPVVDYEQVNFEHTYTCVKKDDADWHDIAAMLKDKYEDYEDKPQVRREFAAIARCLSRIVSDIKNMEVVTRSCSNDVVVQLMDELKSWLKSFSSEHGERHLSLNAVMESWTDLLT
eukprot:s5266_g4.t1